MMEQKNQNETNDTGLSNEELNIFSELSGDLDFWEEKISINQGPQKKDLEYYLKLFWNIFLWVNILWILWIVLFYVFLHIQNSQNQFDKSYLNAFCGILLPEEHQYKFGSSCSWVKSLLVNVSWENEKLKTETVQELNSLVDWIYQMDNFINSKEVAFLLDKKSSKLNVLDILNDFDKMKNDFLDSDKKSIDCKDIKMKNDNTVTFECFAYSSNWDMNIKSASWKKIEWTSITLAASFLDFIQNNPSYNFKLLEKQTDFTAESLIWEWNFVKSTKFSFVLEYNNLKNSLSQ